MCVTISPSSVSTVFRCSNSINWVLCLVFIFRSQLKVKAKLASKTTTWIATNIYIYIYIKNKRFRKEIYWSFKSIFVPLRMKLSAIKLTPNHGSNQNLIVVTSFSKISLWIYIIHCYVQLDITKKCYLQINKLSV